MNMLIFGSLSDFLQIVLDYPADLESYPCGWYDHESNDHANGR